MHSVHCARIFAWMYASHSRATYIRERKGEKVSVRQNRLPPGRINAVLRVTEKCESNLADDASH